MRRVVENMVVTLPFGLILAIPVLFGIGTLYEWAHPDAAAHDAVLRAKQSWLNPTSFYLPNGDLLPALESLGNPDLQALRTAGQDEKPRPDAHHLALVRSGPADADPERNAGIVRLEHVA